MNTEPISSSAALPPPPPPSTSAEESHPLALPLLLSSSSSSLKPLRERNRTNLKRRTNLSRSQVLSNDFENEDSHSTPNRTIKTTTITHSQPPSTPTTHTHTELYSKTVSPTTPSPIHTTVTCSQVWDRLASNEEHQTPVSTNAIITPTVSTSSIPTHIYFTYDSSDEEGANPSTNDKDDFQYVPLSSQSKLVQFQFLAFARQQQLDSDNDQHGEKTYDDSDDDEEENTIISEDLQDDERDEEEGQENRSTKKRKRSVSSTDSLAGIPLPPMTNDETADSSSVTKKPCTKKPKIKDPNANFQRLNMRKKQFSHGKKHQFAKHKRNAFYRRTRNAGGSK